MSSNYKIETKCIQSGWQPKKGEPRVLPIYQSTTFKYETSLILKIMDIFIQDSKIRQTTQSLRRFVIWRAVWQLC